MIDALLTQPDPVYFLVVIFIISLLALAAGYVAAVRFRKSVAVAQSFDTMGDVANEETAAINNHVPVPLLGIVILCTLLGAALLGLTFGRVRAPNRAVSVIFCVLFAATVFSIVDLDHPRGGLLTIDVAPLQNAASSMNQP